MSQQPHRPDNPLTWSVKALAVNVSSANPSADFPISSVLTLLRVSSGEEVTVQYGGPSLPV